MRVMAGESRLGEIHIATESEVTNNQFCNTILIRRRGRRERRIFYRYSEPDFPGTSNSQNYAVVAVLPYAMATGLDIRCFGPVDADLIEQLEECQDAWAMWRPDLFRVIRILPDTIAPSRLPTSRKAIIAFSGGLDSRRQTILVRKCSGNGAGHTRRLWSSTDDCTDQLARSRRSMESQPYFRFGSRPAPILGRFFPRHFFLGFLLSSRQI